MKAKPVISSDLHKMIIQLASDAENGSNADRMAAKVLYTLLGCSYDVYRLQSLCTVTDEISKKEALRLNATIIEVSMTPDEFRSLPRRRANDFVNPRQRHKILPQGFYTGNGFDLEFHNRRKTPPGLPVDATCVDCIEAILRQAGHPMEATDIAKSLNVEYAEVSVTLQRTPERFTELRPPGQRRGILWWLSDGRLTQATEPTPELIQRMTELLSVEPMTSRGIAKKLRERPGVIRAALKVGNFEKFGKPMQNGSGSKWRVKP